MFTPETAGKSGNALDLTDTGPRQAAAPRPGSPVATQLPRHTKQIHKDRMTATLCGEFAVFMIGMRINKPLRVDKWIPIAAAMTRMLNELYAYPELGLLHHEQWFSRTIMMVQYWRSMEHLLAYSKSRDNAHLPAMRDFFRRVGRDGTVGIWHETYLVRPGSYENVYANMPAFGLGRAGVLSPARGRLETAAGRVAATA
jgi:hypothetical protein